MKKVSEPIKIFLLPVRSRTTLTYNRPLGEPCKPRNAFAMHQNEVGSGGSTMRTPAGQPVMVQSQSMSFIIMAYSAALVGRT